MSALEQVVEELRGQLAAKNQARESALALSRETVRSAANAIRALHRHDFATAQRLADQGAASLARAVETLAEHADILHAGFVGDAAKEVVEARIVLAVVQGSPLPTPDALGVDAAAYLNGLAEAVGELRRHLLDYLRRGEVGRCEPMLEIMDEIYSHLVTIDFPDALTGGLRRQTDAVRGILERTRGDLTLAIRQRDLEARLAALERRLPDA